MKYWLLLDQYTSPTPLPQIWKHGAPKIHFLFADTSLGEYKEEGPVLISGDNEQLISSYQTNPQDWSGLIITSMVTEEILLKHLRALLFVTYPPESKGVLTYYDKRTAHYLFNFTEPEHLAQWLGPITALKWFGGSWQSQANNTFNWYELKQPNQKSQQPLSPYHPLTEGQQQGLQQARQHKYAYDWSWSRDKNFDLTYQHLQEAIRLNFDDLEYLNQYLDLREQYSQALIPVQLMGKNAEERLQNLETFWNTNGQVIGND